MTDETQHDLSIDEIIDSKEAFTEPVTIALSADVARTLARLRDEVDRASMRLDSRIGNSEDIAAYEDAKLRLDAAIEEAKSDGRTATFVFRALGRQEFEDLRDEYPATKEQRNQYRKAALSQGVPPSKIGTLGYDPDVFPPILIAASCIKPVMTEEQAKRLWDSPAFSQSELQVLFATAYGVNAADTRVDLGEG